MTAPVSSRPHLVERAVEALGGAGVRPAADPPAAEPRQPDPPAPAPAPAPAALPRVDFAQLQRAGLAVWGPGVARSRVFEEVSVVQHQIVRTIKEIPPSEGRSPRLVLITSAKPGEGKTFCALNIAAAIAADGASRVLLVDADSKPGALTDLLGCRAEPGLRALAADMAQPVEPLLLSTVIERLSFMPYGRSFAEVADQPTASMLTEAVLRLATALPRHIVVVDAPPCLSTSEPSTLAGVVGQTVLVVQAENTQRAEVEASLDLIESCPTIQLLLNQTRTTARDSFGAYGYYHKS